MNKHEARNFTGLRSAATDAEAVAWQFRVANHDCTKWGEWQNCEYWQFDKIQTALKSGWRDPKVWEVRELCPIARNDRGSEAR